MRTMEMTVAVALAAFNSVGVAAEAPPMEEIEGGSYPIGSTDGHASAHNATTTGSTPRLRRTFRCSNDSRPA